MKEISPIISISTTGNVTLSNVSINVTQTPDHSHSVLSVQPSTLPPPYISSVLASTASTLGSGIEKLEKSVFERVYGKVKEHISEPAATAPSPAPPPPPEVEEEPHQTTRSPRSRTGSNKSSRSLSGSPLRSKRRRRHDSDSEVGHLPTYPFDADWRGYALIFEHIHFMGAKDSNRKGSEKDREALISLFRDMKLAPKVFYDLTKKDILNVIEKHTKLEEQKQAQALFLAFLSHGDESGIMTFDRLQQIDLDQDILPLLYAAKAPLLANKPKIILQQACRGEILDCGYSKPLDELDCPSTTTAAIREVTPTIQDCFIFYSGAKYFMSIRSPDTGSWFIQELVNVIRKYSFHYPEGELERIAKRVIYQITQMEGNVKDNETGLTKRAKCTPEYRNLGFKKDMYFGDLRVPGGSSTSEGRRERPNSLM